MYFLHLMVIFSNSARDVLPIDINSNFKIKAMMYHTLTAMVRVSYISAFDIDIQITINR